MTESNIVNFSDAELNFADAWKTYQGYEVLTISSPVIQLPPMVMTSTETLLTPVGKCYLLQFLDYQLPDPAYENARQEFIHWIHSVNAACRQRIASKFKQSRTYEDTIWSLDKLGRRVYNIWSEVQPRIAVFRRDANNMPRLVETRDIKTKHCIVQAFVKFQSLTYNADSETMNLKTIPLTIHVYGGLNISDQPDLITRDPLPNLHLL